MRQNAPPFTPLHPQQGPHAVPSPTLAAPLQKNREDAKVGQFCLQPGGCPTTPFAPTAIHTVHAIGTVFTPATAAAPDTVLTIGAPWRSQHETQSRLPFSSRRLVDDNEVIIDDIVEIVNDHEVIVDGDEQQVVDDGDEEESIDDNEEEVE
ncbi:MAG: hypothetical protein LQ338_001795 [Usnochroma carphineum]|nr:MAG: hypothetical protein LQ338_001795 [Usnochroma carphineum]